MAINPTGFGANRAKFVAGVETYSSQARGIARDVLHAIFFTPRGSPPPFIKQEIAARVDAVHDMFKLKTGEALIDREHPVGKEYDWPVGGSAIRFFPLPPGAECKTIVKPVAGSATLDFLEALGKSQVLLGAINQTTDAHY